MQVTEARVSQYVKIYENKFKKTISREKAYVELLALVTLMESVYRYQNKTPARTGGLINN